MTQETATPSKKANGLVPPDEQFWKRYSPHYEFPLSSVTSVAMHVLVIVSLALGAFFAPRLGCLGGKDDPLPIVATYVEGGGGGDRNGADGGREGAKAASKEAVDQSPAPKSDNPAPLNPTLDIPKLDPADLSRFKDERGTALIDGTKAYQDLISMREKVRKDLFNSVAGPKGGGPGADGGRDGGRDKGVGDKAGHGGTLNKRQKRVLRWILTFDTHSGTDYANQLHALGAMIAYPNPSNPDELLFIEDLSKRPAKGRALDVTKINRIFWTDSETDSVRSLAVVFKLQPTPTHIVALFPDHVEAKLLKLELGYKGKTEDTIRETRFRIVRKGNSYEPEVESQQ